MYQKSAGYTLSFLVLAGIMACSISGIGQGIKSAEQTSRGVRTKISGAVTVGSSIIENAQTFEAQSRAVIATVKAVTTQEAPIISTGEAAATQFPQYIQTVQAIFKDKVPSGEPPSDIPLQDMAQMEDFFASSQYIFYITPVKYAQVLSFYRIGMADNGWEYQQDESSEYAQATQMIFYKDSRTAVVNLSYNTLNNTTVVIITIISQ